MKTQPLEKTIKLSPTGEVLVAEEENHDFIGEEIDHGVCAIRTSLKEIKLKVLKRIVKKIKKIILSNYIVEILEGDDDHIWITFEGREDKKVVIGWVMKIFQKITNCEFIDYEGEPIIDCPVNSIEIEKGKVIHRKGAIQANIEQLGIIQGDTTKYIVRGYGNTKTHSSCSYKGEGQTNLVDFKVELVPLVKIEV